MTTTGTIVMTVDLFALSGLEDPEGLALDGDTLYVAFDPDRKIGVFRIVPEPSTAVLLGLTLTAWTRSRRRTGTRRPREDSSPP